MTDYYKDSGTGQLKMSDSGSWVDFYFRAGYSSDWWNGLEFNWTANGSTTSKTIDYPSGGDWYHVGWVNVSTSQTVSFRLVTATGISGMGGPTTLSVSINRDTTPGAPSKPTLSNIKSTSVDVKFTDGSNGGDSIDSRQIGYATSASGTKTTVSSDGSTTVTGLSPAKTYYFFARTHNSQGWGPWSSYATATTLNTPSAPPQPLLASVTADTVDVSWAPSGSSGGATITAYQVGWGTSSSAPTKTANASSPYTVTGLSPGTLYYFFIRAQNSVGWSAWSVPNNARTVAGAYILVGTVWKLAIPYVNVGGVWKPAETWVRNLGTWSQTT